MWKWFLLLIGLVLGVCVAWFAQDIRRQRRIYATTPGISLAEYRFGSIVGLYASGSDFGSAELRAVVGLTHLEELQLDYTSIRDEDICRLALLPALRTLWVYDHRLGDESIGGLASLKNLQVLGVRLPNVTDGGILALSQLRQLKFLRIEAGTFSSKSIDDLKRALPACEVEIDIDETPNRANAVPREEERNKPQADAGGRTTDGK